MIHYINERKNKICSQDRKTCLSRLELQQLRRHVSSKSAFVRGKPNCIVGTIGHHQHGKTTLTSAITKVLSMDDNGLRSQYKRIDELDKSSEEQKRGIGIQLAHVEYETSNRHYAHIDCPGHKSYIKQAIAGIHQLDGAVLVVSAVDGCLAGTREHLVLARYGGVKRVLTFINKCDAVETAARADMLELVECDVRELLTDVGFDGVNSPVIKGSATAALQGSDSDVGTPAVRSLLHHMDTHLEIPERRLDAPFMMCIERINEIPNRGVVVSGVVVSGEVRKGDTCHILGYDTDISVRVAGIEIFLRALDPLGSARAGDQHVSLLLRGDLTRGGLRRGMMCVGAPHPTGSPAAGQHSRFTADVEMSDNARQLVNDETVHIYCRTWSGVAEVEVDDQNVTFCLNRSMVCDVGWTFTIRTDKETLGCAQITHILKPYSEQEKQEKIKRRKLKRKEEAEGRKLNIGHYAGSP